MAERMMFTARLKIRKFRISDLDAMVLLLSDEAVMKYMEKPYTREETEVFLSRYGMTDTPLIYAVETRDTGVFIGYVIYHPKGNSSYEIGWVLCANQWGKGYAAELTSCLIDDARTKADNLMIECSPQQLITQKIARQYGFSFVKNEDGLDVYMLSLRPSCPCELKKAEK